MMTVPEVRISGRLRETLEDLRAVTNDRQLCELMDAGQEHASFHELVGTGVRGLHKYLGMDDAPIEPRGDAGGQQGQSLAPEDGASGDGASFPGDAGLLLAERSLAVIDAALFSAAHCTRYESSLAVQEGLAHIRERIHAALDDLKREDHRPYLEKLAESLCHELSLRLAHSNGS